MLYAMPPPTPPSVNEGRITIGKPSDRASSIASGSERARPLCGTSRPISRIASLNSCRSSATLIAWIEAPMSSTLVLLERAGLREIDGQVQRGLPADRRQQRIRALPLDDRRQDLGRERLDVRAIRQIRVGHDRRRDCC